MYIPNHAGSQLPNEQTIVASSTMANTVSHLRQIFRELGRGQQWDPQQQHGNPACASELSQYGQGHRATSNRAGFRERGAVPMTEPKVLQLLTHLAESAFLTDSTSPLNKAMLARDGFAFCLLWQTGMRV